MPSSCGYVWSADLDNVIRAEAQVAGVPLDLAYAIIAAESSFDPRAHALSAIEDSVGLLQLNRRGGQGTGYSVEQLMDPQLNLRLGLPAIRRAFEQSWQPNIDPFEFIYRVATRSGHPGDIPRNDPRILKVANAWACFYGIAGFSLNGPTPAPGAVGGPSTILTAAMAVPFSVIAVPIIIAAYLPTQLFASYVLNPQRQALLAAGLSRQEDPRNQGLRLGRLVTSGGLNLAAGRRDVVSLTSRVF